MKASLSPEALRKNCLPEDFAFETIEGIPGVERIIGQERAVRALRFGLGNKAAGFNVYVAGPPGTGKLTAVRNFLQDLAQHHEGASDWCYVNNFRDPYFPKKLELPAGYARKFQKDMRKFVEEARLALTRAFESETFTTKREDLLGRMEKQKNEQFQQVQEYAGTQGFAIKPSPMGILTIPVKDGNPLTNEQFQALPKEKQAEILENQEKLQERIKISLRKIRESEKEVQAEMEKLEREVALFSIDSLIAELREAYGKIQDVSTFLDNVKNEILDNLAAFLQPDGQPENPLQPLKLSNEALKNRFEVNVIVDNTGLKGAPLIFEANPTYNNLFGKVEHKSQMGALFTDFTLIRPGALHLANGGYLVLQAEELLRNFFSWDSLKRAIRNREVAIEEAGDRLGYLSTRSLKPEPIPLDFEVILIGRPEIYHLLYNYDEDFRELFKVKADFDTKMDRTEENIQDYVSFICKVCKEENLLLLRDSAIAEMVEYGSRLAEDQEKLSTRFGEISDVIREASHYAKQQKAGFVSADHIREAIDQQFYRSNLLQEKIQELIQRNTILIDVEGEISGQVNGLAVLDLGDIRFGKPSRITVSIGIGKAGILDIEREAKLGGPIHTKGVLILSGFLMSRYGAKQPLSLSATLVFEQSYSGVDGDSASSTELYAILSELAGLPVKQGIAVTGSVNQKGEVQAIGGVNEKIEGFFAICKHKGLTGSQGVIIPEANRQELMLKKEVVQAVKDGLFQIWVVNHIDEGIEILTGTPAGEMKPDGSYPEGSVNALVLARFEELNELLKGKEENNKSEGS